MKSLEKFVFIDTYEKHNVKQFVSQELIFKNYFIIQCSLQKDCAWYPLLIFQDQVGPQL